MLHFTSRPVPRDQAEVLLTEDGKTVEVVQRYPDGDSLFYCDGVLMVGRLVEAEE